MTAATWTAPDGLGPARFEHAVRREVTRRGKARPCLRIVRKLFAALTDTAGVLAHRPAAFERIAWVIEDWDHAKTKLVDTEARMVAVLDELELTELATLHRRPVPGRGRSDPGRDRRPDPVHLRPGRGQTRRPGTAGTQVRHLHRPSPPVAAPAGRCCAPPHGGPCGAACRPTGCTPPATGT